MVVQHLRPISEAPDLNTLAQRMERLRADAAAVANEHIQALAEALAEAAAVAEQVANGGEAYPVGVREIARRAHKELQAMTTNLQVLRERSR